MTSSFAQIVERMSSLTLASAAGDSTSASRCVRSGAVELADHERAVGGLREVAGAEVGGAPLDDAGDQVALADQLLQPVLHQAVAEADERRPSSGFTAS